MREFTQEPILRSGLVTPRAHEERSPCTLQQQLPTSILFCVNLLAAAGFPQTSSDSSTARIVLVKETRAVLWGMGPCVALFTIISWRALSTTIKFYGILYEQPITLCEETVSNLGPKVKRDIIYIYISIMFKRAVILKLGRLTPDLTNVSSAPL